MTIQIPCVTQVLLWGLRMCRFLAKKITNQCAKGLICHKRVWLICADAADRSYRTGSDTEGAATTDNPTTPFPTPPPTLTPNHRQASPFPLESTNSRRHHYNGSVSSERSRNGNGKGVNWIHERVRLHAKRYFHGKEKSCWIDRIGAVMKHICVINECLSLSWISLFVYLAHIMKICLSSDARYWILELYWKQYVIYLY